MSIYIGSDLEDRLEALEAENVPLTLTLNTGNVKVSDHCFIGDLGLLPSNTYLTGCIGEIIGFYRSLTDKETSYIHKHLMKKWGI